MTTDHLYDPIGDVIRDDVPRELPVQLTDHERLEVAESKSAAEDELVALRRQYHERAKEIGRRIGELGAALRDRTQRRLIVCYERWNKGEVEVVRRDIDPRDPASVIERRVATLEESQRALVPPEPSKPAGKAKPGKGKKRA